MIRFSEFLAESHSAPLYHATFLHNADKIINTNKLIGTIQDGGNAAKIGKKVIFVTRSLKHAHHLYGGMMGKAVFELDQTKLRHRFKIRPIKNWTDFQIKNHKPSYMADMLGGNEFEEVIIADVIDNLDDYIKSVHVKDKIDPNKYPNLAAYDKLNFV